MLKLLVLLPCIALAANANFFLKDGSKKTAEFIELRNDTVFVQIQLPDGKKSSKTFLKNSFEKIVFSTGESLDLSRTNFNPEAKTVVKDEWGVQPEEAKTAVAVSDFTGTGMEPALLKSLTDRFSSELLSTQRFRVMERNQMELILKEQGFQASGACDEASCLVEIGQLIAVDKMVTGSIAKVGGFYTVSAKIINVATGNIEKNLSEDCDCPIEAVLTGTLGRLAKRLAGMAVEEKKDGVSVMRGDAGLFVKSVPDGGRVYLDGKLLDGMTPLNVENLVSGKHLVEVKKTVEGVAWNGKSEVSLVSNQLTRIEVALEKAKTALKIATTPSEAEVYLDKKKGFGIKPDHISPVMLYDLQPGKRDVFIFKPGSRDTSLSMDIKEFELNALDIRLAEETDIAAVQGQKTFVKKRSQRFKAKWMFYGAGALAVTSGALYYLGQKDYADATDIKKKLDKGVIRNDAFWADMDKNNDLSSSGDFKSTMSVATGTLGGLLLGWGLWLYF